MPRSALFLGLAGLIPFVWGALTLLSDGLSGFGLSTFGARFIGPYVQIFYGTIILAFMSGVLWGFATRAEGRMATVGYALSVIPALWAFFFVGGGPVSAQVYLIFGYLGLLALDWMYWRLGLAPAWWMQLRIPLTTVVVISLGVGVLG